MYASAPNKLCTSHIYNFMFTYQGVFVNIPKHVLFSENDKEFTTTSCIYECHVCINSTRLPHMLRHVPHTCLNTPSSTPHHTETQTKLPQAATTNTATERG